jgi:hypothetical protein
MPNKTGDTRYGHRAGSGANEPKRHEKKEQASDWQPRQGGDQTRSGEPDEPPERDATGKDALARDPRSAGKQTRGHDEVATRRHLEGSEQGPS